MKTYWKGVLAALALGTAATAAAAPAKAQDFGVTVGPHGGIGFSYDSGGYCDDQGCPDDFWDMPVYYGPVFWDGQWFDGPVYYRDWYGRRQFWIDGGWRFDQWRGPHPGWWREGRYGPALGPDFYRSHGFHGAWDHGGDRGGDRGWNRGGYGPRDDHGGNRDSYNRGGDPRGYDQHGPDQHGPDPRNVDPRGPQPGAQGYRGYNRGAQPQAARPAPMPQPAPQAQPAPQTQPAPQGHGGRDGTPPDGPHRDHGPENER